MKADDALAALQALRTHAAVGDLLHVSPRRLRYLLYRRPATYSEFTIPKRTGGDRRILVPPEHICAWQRVLARLLTHAYKRPRSVFGFCSGVGIRENAALHVGRRVVIGVDLKDFFESITHGRVMGLFCGYPFSIPPEVAAVLAQLCTYRGVLPQGAPSSPPITNWICRSLDRQLFRFARERRVYYSRYADDLTFSSGSEGAAHSFASVNGGSVVLSRKLRRIVRRNGFRINDHKTRVAFRSQRQRVTGLCVNQKVNLPREYLREVRVLLRRWARDGYSSAERWFVEAIPGCPRAFDLGRYIQGKLAFASHVRGLRDPVVLRYRLAHAELTAGRGGSVEICPAEASPDWKRLVSSALFLVRAYDSSGGEVGTGTAFSVGGRVLATAWHVCQNSYEGGEAAARLSVSSAQRLEAGETDVELGRYSAHADVALLLMPAPACARFTLASSPADDGAQVLAAGFAGFATTGDGLWFEDARVSQLATKSGVRQGRLSTAIVSGASGGPVFDCATGEVLGVLVGGADHPRAAHGFIEARHIRALLDVPGD